MAEVSEMKAAWPLAQHNVNRLHQCLEAFSGSRGPSR